jgi:microcystin-dependent protein
VPTAPTAALATNTTQLATTAFVQAAMALAGDLPLMVGAADGSTDLDTIQTAGWFDKLLGSANAHLPVSGNYFYVQTLVYAAGALTQVAYPYSTQATISLGIYVRGLYGGVWSPWNRLNLDATKLPLTGGTLTGNLTIDPANGMAGVSCSSADSHSYLVLDKGIVGAYSYIDGRYAGKVRWRMILGEATAEAGSNAGSNFVLQAYDDAGTAVVANALSIARSTGVVTMPGAIIPTRPAGDATGYAANTAFVTAVDVLKAPLASPAFTGVPTAPTPAVTSNDNTLATTAFATYTAPPGLIGFFARSTAPTGWIAANGALLNRTTYAILFAAIGTVFGAGDGTTTFGIPDLRGEFPRGWDNARGIDASRVFGSLQLDGIETHTHPFTGSAMATHDHGLTVGANSVGHTHSFADNSSATGNASANHQHTMTGRIPNTTVANGFGMGSGVLYSDNPLTSASGAAHTHTVAVAGTSGGISANHVHTIDITAVSAGTPAGTVGANTGAVTETRPRNVALLACIKYC